MHIYESIRQSMFVPIHPAGWPFIAIFALVGLLLTLSGMCCLPRGCC